MFIIDRTLSSKIMVLDALKRRTDERHPKYEFIASLLRRAEIGYRGEIKVDRMWKEITVPNNALLIHSFETKNEVGNPHQIDTLFICPHFIFILEIKNISGFIWYEKNKHQLLRKKGNGEVESFHSPLDQVQRHAELIERIIGRFGYTLPVHKAVIIAESSTIIGHVPNETPIFHAIGLPSEVKKLLLKYSDFALPQLHYEQLTNYFRSIHKPSIYVPNFEVPPLCKGAICSCGNRMEYNHGRFLCICGIQSKEPLFQGLHDYRVLFDEWITNRAFREFFFIDNEGLVNKILKRLGFYYEGKTKSRRYLIPSDVWNKNQWSVRNF
ncbi:nuclease-related domain-containing protein [Ureibacillus sinduriensis]|uniref:nuclease-related domain-containing protein n=1 Tax=Ureibacillus sinduriensis TaxID=561440 RepID=UPI00068DE8F6|nr:nuclease-related domain-containing protein [Ureibacillus sinduriensis]